MGAKAVFKNINLSIQIELRFTVSRGGSVTLNCLFQYPEIFHTGIAVAAVTNQLSYDNIYQERYMGDPHEGFTKLYRWISNYLC